MVDLPSVIQGLFIVLGGTGCITICCGLGYALYKLRQHNAIRARERHSSDDTPLVETLPM